MNKIKYGLINAALHSITFNMQYSLLQLFKCACLSVLHIQFLLLFG